MVDLSGGTVDQSGKIIDFALSGNNGAITPCLQRREREVVLDLDRELVLRDLLLLLRDLLLLPFVSPDFERCLFTMRAATSFARPP
jgi:hypothetical protein